MNRLQLAILGGALFSLPASTGAAAQQAPQFPAADTVDGIEYRAGIEATQEGMNIRGVLASAAGYRVFLVAKNVSSEPMPTNTGMYR